MTYRRGGDGTYGAYANQDDIRPATATHQGLMPKTDKAKLDAATSANTGGTLVLRDGGGNVTVGNINTGTINGTTVGAATAWTLATGLYAANWAGFGTAGFADVKYRVTLEGMVQLLGLAKKSAALALPDTIFTLPVGFRPATTHIFVTASALGTYTEIRVNTGGAVFIQVGGSAGFTALDGISFDPAQ